MSGKQCHSLEKELRYAMFPQVMAALGQKNMNDPGYRDTATCNENHNRFIRKIVESETVWALSNENGYAYAASNEDENPPDVILFWSDKAYAKRAKQSNYPEYKETTISLFNFLYRWLPGM